MKKRLLASVFSLTLLAVPASTYAQSTDFSAAIARMDAIIAEMNALRSEFSSLVQQTGATSAAPAVLGATTANLGDDLRYGATNEGIARMQRLLATDPEIYPYGVDSGFFGPKTQEAVRRFQSRFGLDTVGVVGPATKALLETYVTAYPSENYPSDMLTKPAPAPAAAAATVSTPVAQPTAAAATTATTATLKSLTVSEDDGEYIVRSFKADGTRNRDLILYADNYDDLVDALAKKLGASEAEIKQLLPEDDVDFDDGARRDDDDYDEDDAEDAIDEADEAIDDARDAIREADDDGDDVDEADEYYDDARDEYRKAKDALDDEDYEDAVKNAEDAIELVEKALDALDGTSSSNDDDIDVIEVRMYDGEARVTVEYENGDDDRFTVNDDDREDVIKEIADELNMDDDDVEDLVEFDYGDLSEVYAYRSDGKTRVVVTFESDLEVKLVLSDDTEDDVIEAVADELDLDEDDVSRVFDGDL